MSKHVNYERTETKTAADNGRETDGSIHSLSIRVDYYRSLEYIVKWKSHMYTRNSLKLRNASKNNAQESPSTNEDVIRHRLRSKRHWTWLKEADNSVVNADEGSSRDIIDLINCKHDAEQMTVEDDGKFKEIADKGVNESDEDCGSDNSSIVSGPYLLRSTSPKKAEPSQVLCSACQKLYQKAKKMKARINDKLLDNDPSSLTCDQWVLLKQRRPRRLLGARGNLLMYLQLVKKSVKQREQYRDSSPCSRPHTFLQRNLRQPVKVPVKKERKNRRKRARADSQDFRVAKQKRLHSNNARQHTSVNCADDNGLHPAGGHSSSPGFEGCNNKENDNEADAYMIETIPSSVSTSIPTKSVDLSLRKKAAKKPTRFRDLLAQLRGNSSVIVRETR